MFMIEFYKKNILFVLKCLNTNITSNQKIFNIIHERYTTYVYMLLRKQGVFYTLQSNVGAVDRLWAFRTLRPQSGVHCHYNTMSGERDSGSLAPHV